MSASWQSANMAQPADGSRNISYAVDFRSVAEVKIDLTQDIETGRLGFVQSVYIDNADNSSVVDLIFTDAPIVTRIRAQAYTQGWYAVPNPVGALHITARSNSAAVINVIFANYAMPYIVSGPPSGITVVPALTNVGFDPQVLAAANNNLLVGGVGGQTVKVYRGIFEVDAAAVLKFTDGIGGTVLFSASLGPGGSIALPVSGVPWFSTAAGNGLYLDSSAICNLYGAFGFEQS